MLAVMKKMPINCVSNYPFSVLNKGEMWFATRFCQATHLYVTGFAKGQHETGVLKNWCPPGKPIRYMGYILAKFKPVEFSYFM